MTLRNHLDITELDSTHMCNIILALDSAVEDIGDVTIGAVADLMARVTSGLGEPRPWA